MNDETVETRRTRGVNGRGPWLKGEHRGDSKRVGGGAAAPPHRVGPLHHSGVAAPIRTTRFRAQLSSNLRRA